MGVSVLLCTCGGEPREHTLHTVYLPPYKEIADSRFCPTITGDGRSELCLWCAGWLVDLIEFYPIEMLPKEMENFII